MPNKLTKNILRIFMIMFFSQTAVHALEVNITPEKAYIVTVHDDREVKILRVQDQSHALTGGYTKTSRKCPPFCIQPMEVSPGVDTIGELELLDFIETQLNNGTGVLIDSRTAAWHKQGTIPGSINIPFTTFSADSSDMVKTSALSHFGVTRKDGSESLLDNVQRFLFNNPDMSNEWDFSKAKELVLWCNGMWCGQSPHAIRGLLSLGYPADKIHYYRGGMQSWLMLGLTVVKPN